MQDYTIPSTDLLSQQLAALDNKISQYELERTRRHLEFMASFNKDIQLIKESTKQRETIRDYEGVKVKKITKSDSGIGALDTESSIELCHVKTSLEFVEYVEEKKRIRRTFKEERRVREVERMRRVVKVIRGEIDEIDEGTVNESDVSIRETSEQTMDRLQEKKDQEEEMIVSSVRELRRVFEQ